MYEVMKPMRQAKFNAVVIVLHRLPYSFCAKSSYLLHLVRFETLTSSMPV